MPGKRTKDDPKNIEGTGFGLNDPVIVDHCGNERTRGRVENVHGKGGKMNKVDVRIDHPKSEEHGRVVTFDIDDVEAAPLEEKAASSK